MSTPAAPEDPDRLAAVEALMSTSRLMTAVVALTLGQVDDVVTVPQLRALVMLYFDGPLNLSAIAEGLAVNPSNASRTCDKLVRGGLVDRAEDDRDRRNVVIRLTTRGRRLVDSLMDERRRILDQVVGAMRSEDRRALARALEALLAAVEHAAEADSGMEPGLRPGAILPWIR